MKKSNNAAELRLSANCRKALTVHLGEAAGRELADVLARLADHIERLEQNKVDVMPVIRQTGKDGRPKSRRRTTD
jgi:hypothetical protein